MKKVLYLICAFCFNCIFAKEFYIPKVTDELMIRSVPGFREMTEAEKIRAKIKVATGIREGMHLQHLLTLKELGDKDCRIGREMKEIDGKFCKAIEKVDRQIVELEHKVKECCKGYTGKESRLRSLGKKIGEAVKYTAVRIKDCCQKVKCKFKSKKNKQEAKNGAESKIENKDKKVKNK